MSRASDAAIARAFYEACDKGERYFDELWVIERARQIDAEAGGTDRQTDEICEPCGYVRWSLGCDDAHKKREQLTTSPERVQIPAESEHVALVEKVACPIPTCRAELLPGQHCGGKDCGLRRAE